MYSYNGKTEFSAASTPVLSVTFIQISIIIVINFGFINYDELYDYYYIFYFYAVISCSPAHPENSLAQYFAPRGPYWLCHSHYSI